MWGEWFGGCHDIPEISTLLYFISHIKFTNFSVLEDFGKKIIFSRDFLDCLQWIGNFFSGLSDYFVFDVFQGFVKIARWTDMNYWALKQTTDKTHRTLHKHIKSFQVILIFYEAFIQETKQIIKSKTLFQQILVLCDINFMPKTWLDLKFYQKTFIYINKELVLTFAEENIYLINWKCNQTCLMWPSKGKLKYGHIREVVAKYRFNYSLWREIDMKVT